MRDASIRQETISGENPLLLSGLRVCFSTTASSNQDYAGGRLSTQSSCAQSDPHRVRHAPKQPWLSCQSMRGGRLSWASRQRGINSGLSTQPLSSRHKMEIRRGKRRVYLLSSKTPSGPFLSILDAFRSCKFCTGVTCQMKSYLPLLPFISVNFCHSRPNLLHLFGLAMAYRQRGTVDKGIWNDLTYSGSFPKMRSNLKVKPTYRMMEKLLHQIFNRRFPTLHGDLCWQCERTKCCLRWNENLVGFVAKKINNRYGWQRPEIVGGGKGENSITRSVEIHDGLLGVLDCPHTKCQGNQLNLFEVNFTGVKVNSEKLYFVLMLYE